MVGYNIEKINELIVGLNNSYKKLGETMAAEWSGVSATLESEWIGPDEVSFETELANKICDLYLACHQNVEQMIKNVREVGIKWQDFQRQNVLEGAATSGFLQNRASQITDVSLVEYDIKNIVKAGSPTFTSSTNLGVKNGEASATTINEKVTTYITNIHDNVKAMYSQMEVSTAFLDATQAQTIKTYMEAIAASVAKLTTCVDDMRTSLAQLVKNYVEQAATFNESIKGIDTNIATENAIDVSSGS